MKDEGGRMKDEGEDEGEGWRMKRKDEGYILMPHPSSFIS